MNELSKQYGTFEIQTKLLDMIAEIDSLFKTNSISYSLCGGTLLGAIREKGFIPWDDDFDIMVNRDNYNKIVSLLNGEPGMTFALNRNFWVDRIYKIGDNPDGIYSIDLFVMDNCPDNRSLSLIKELAVKTLQGTLKETKPYNDNHSIFYRISLWATYYMGKPFPRHFKLTLYRFVSQIGNRKKTESVSGYNDLFSLISLKYPSSLMDSLSLTQFEDLYLPITNYYDEYLTIQYGDYMTPPEINNRIPSHGRQNSHNDQ